MSIDAGTSVSNNIGLPLSVASQSIPYCNGDSGAVGVDGVGKGIHRPGSALLPCVVGVN